MKINQLIVRLQEIQAQEGNLDIRRYDEDGNLEILAERVDVRTDWANELYKYILIS